MAPDRCLVQGDGMTMVSEPPVASDLLTADQIGAGLVTLRSFSDERWTEEDAKEWRRALRLYRSGELARALDAWELTPAGTGRRRPRPEDLAPLRRAGQLAGPPTLPPRTKASDRAATETLQTVAKMGIGRRARNAAGRPETDC